MSRTGALAAAVPLRQPTAVSVSGLLRRKCACGSKGGSGGTCKSCEDEKLRRRATGHASEGPVPDSVRQVLRSPGEALDHLTRDFMESRFGHDFAGVRVHTDATAARSAESVEALAYSVGPHIVFGRNRFAPNSLSGRELLAHELAHTALQPRMPALDRLQIGAAEAPEEHAADRAAHRALAGGEPLTARAAAPALLLRRQPEKGAGAGVAKTGPCVIHFHKGTTEFIDAKEFDQCMKRAKAFLRSAGANDIVELHGFASEEGDVPANMDLSQRRAAIVQLLLGQGGVDKTRIKIEAHGEDKTYPTLPENRRVEVRMAPTIDVPESKIPGVPCPPKSKISATTLEDYQILLDCAEKTMGLNAREMLAVFRQIYYGKPWSVAKAPQWDQVIPCSPSPGNPKEKLGDVLFESLRESQEVQGVDVGHVFAGLEAMTCPSSTVTPKAGGAKGSIAGAIGATTIAMSNEDFATWGGDLGAAVAAATICKRSDLNAAKSADCGRKSNQSLKFYLRHHAPDQDLEGDIDPFVQRAQSLGIACGGSRAKKLDLGGKKASDLFQAYYADPDSALGKARAQRARCMLEVFGATFSGKKVSNRDAVVATMSGPVKSFAEAFYVKICRDANTGFRAMCTPDADETLLMMPLARSASEWFIDWLEKRL